MADIRSEGIGFVMEREDSGNEVRIGLGSLAPEVKERLADPINYPAHYTFGAVEVIDAIEAWGLNFARGAVVKYVARAGRKDPAKEIEDLRKAKWYIEREINRLEKERE